MKNLVQWYCYKVYFMQKVMGIAKLRIIIQDFCYFRLPTDIKKQPSNQMVSFSNPLVSLHLHYSSGLCISMDKAWEYKKLCPLLLRW